MSDDNAKHELTYVKDTLNQISRALSQEPCAQLLQRPAVHRAFSNISEALNKKCSPTSHDVDFLIQALRNEKFLYVRECGRTSGMATEIQTLITQLKKTKYLLQLSEPEPTYRSDGNGYIVENKDKNKINSHFATLLIGVFCLSFALSLFGISPLSIYAIGIIICIPSSFSRCRHSVIYSLSCVTIFTLLALAYTYLP